MVPPPLGTSDRSSLGAFCKASQEKISSPGTEDHPLVMYKAMPAHIQPHHSCISPRNMRVGARQPRV